MEFLSRLLFESSVIQSLLLVVAIIKISSMYQKGVAHGIYPKRTKKQKIQTAIFIFIGLGIMSGVVIYLKGQQGDF